MRMRRKKNLTQRLDACSDFLIKVADADIKDMTAGIYEPIDLKAVFGNDNPIHLEIGCGKGRFSVQTAQLNPDINIIAVEKTENVLVTACETAAAAGLSNIKFIGSGAEYLTRYIPPHSIARIYLNFSCPYPKRSYENHRLTNRKFLVIYSRLLAPGAEIHQKTDNMHFFEYSIEQLSSFGFKLKNLSFDLHNSSFVGNIETEYEERFAAQGFPIYRLEAYSDGEKDG